MNTAMKMHVGWRAIAKRLGVRDLRTARRIAEKFSLPIIRFEKAPMMDETIFLIWLSENLKAAREAAAESKTCEGKEPSESLARAGMER